MIRCLNFPECGSVSLTIVTQITIMVTLSKLRNTKLCRGEPTGTRRRPSGRGGLTMSDVLLDGEQSPANHSVYSGSSSCVAAPESQCQPWEVAEALRATQVGIEQFLGNSHAAQSDTFSRMLETLALVRKMPSVADILAAVPEMICTVGRFDRALVSHVRGSTWIPHVTSSLSPGAATGSTPVTIASVMLNSARIEAEVVRRRTTTLVSACDNNLDGYGSIFGDLKPCGYIVTPVTVGGSVSGLLHVDNHQSSRALSEADRDVVRFFAENLGMICERMLLSERAREQQRSMSAAFSIAESMIEDIHLTPNSLATATAPGLQSRAPFGGVVDRTDLVASQASSHVHFTVREWDVLELLATGCTNSDAARRLSVSESTVKSHVKHIHKKLGVNNRAAAIAKYARMTQSRRLQVG